MEGGISAEVTGLEVVRGDGETRKMLVRRHGAVDLAANPRIAADEFRLLQLLRAEGLATPAPCYLDESGEILPTPYLILEYVEGGTEFAPAGLPALLSQMAAHLAGIHRIAGSRPELSFLPLIEKRASAKVRERSMSADILAEERRVCDVLTAGWPPVQRNASVLLHGDFWPGNVLWRDGQLVAIIDWEDAALGDPLADLGNSRLEVLWAFGDEAMQRFTRAYLSLSALDRANLPYWDLYAALRLSFQLADWDAEGPAARARTMRERFQWFLAQAFEQLSAQGLC